MPSQQKNRIRKSKIKNGLQNEIAAELHELHDDSSGEEILKDIEFYNAMLSAERGIMELYKETFKIDPLFDTTYKMFTIERQVERYAQNLAFWQKLLCEYDEDESRTSNPRYVYIKMKESEARINVVKKFKDKYPELLERIFSRLLEIVNHN